MNNVDYIVSTESGDVLIEKDSKRITDDIVDQLVAYRKNLKLTQQDIADATGIKRANIARLELKKNEASLESLVRYAKSMKLELHLMPAFRFRRMELRNTCSQSNVPTRGD